MRQQISVADFSWAIIQLFITWRGTRAQKHDRIFLHTITAVTEYFSICMTNLIAFTSLLLGFWVHWENRKLEINKINKLTRTDGPYNSISVAVQLGGPGMCPLCPLALWHSTTNDSFSAIIYFCAQRHQQQQRQRECNIGSCDEAPHRAPDGHTCV